MSGGSFRKYWKNISNRKIRRNADGLTRGNYYRRVFNFQYDVWK